MVGEVVSWRRGSNSPEDLVDALSPNRSITYLRIRYLTLGEAELASLFRDITLHPTLKEVEFSHCTMVFSTIGESLPPSHVQGESLPPSPVQGGSSPPPSHAQPCRIRIKLVTCRSNSHAMPRPMGYKGQSSHDMPMGYKGQSSIGARCMLDIFIENCSLTPKAQGYILGGMSTHATVSSLCLGYHQIPVVGIRMKDYATQMDTYLASQGCCLDTLIILHSLYIDWDTLAHGLACNTTLKILRLKDVIDIHGYASIPTSKVMRSLIHLPSVEELAMKMIVFSDMDVMKEYLTTSTPLHTLDLSGSASHHWGVFAEGLAGNVGLTSLDISCCSMKGQDLALIGEALSSTSTLTSINIGQVYMEYDIECMRTLWEGLVRVGGMKEIRMRDGLEGIVEDGVKVIMEDYLPKMKHLVILDLSREYYNIRYEYYRDRLTHKGISTVTHYLNGNDSLTNLQMRNVLPCYWNTDTPYNVSYQEVLHAVTFHPQLVEFNDVKAPPSYEECREYLDGHTEPRLSPSRLVMVTPNISEDGVLKDMMGYRLAENRVWWEDMDRYACGRSGLDVVV